MYQKLIIIGNLGREPETWVMNNRNRKRGKPVQTPEAQQDKFRKLYEQQKQVAGA